MGKQKISSVLQEFQHQNESLLAENSYLKQENAELRRIIFGQKSERFISSSSKDQLGLNLGDTPVKEEQQVEQISYERKKTVRKHTPHGRGELPSHLERREIIIEPDEDVSGLDKIGEEVTEELEYEPGRLYVNRYIRPKYVRGDNTGVIIGQLPSRPIERGLAGPGLLSHIMISKYIDHLPVYRQIQQFKRQDVKLAKSTVDNWLRECGKLLYSINEVHRQRLLQSTYLMVDETPIKVLDKGKKGKTHQGYFWVFYDPLRREVLFSYHRGRDSGYLEEMLKDYSGTIQSDGYSAYEKIGKREDIKLISCMAHARRYFEKALKQDRVRAEWMMEQIQVLYKVEAGCREEELSFDQRKTRRQEKSRPILDDMKVWLDTHLEQVLPNSLIGKAIIYMLKRWEGLAGYLEDGCYEIDNNLVENAIRPVALGRKNYLFAGSHNGAERSALIYSLLSTAKLQGLEAFSYMKDLLEKLPDWPQNKVAELLPYNSLNRTNQA